MFSVFFLIFLCSSVSGLQIVKTSYGRLRGISDFSNPDNYKHSFKGIPFTKPPLGKLRFQLPEPPESWSGIRDASKYGPGCMSHMSGQVEETSKNEDCLFLNIFTSDRCLQKACPVIVFFHGGAFTSALATMMPAKSILDRYVEQDIVFVVPAFRLGVFGQFYLGDPDVTVPNLLVYDCIAALKYVNSEIQAFGGNPNDVTLMGHSSGGSLVDALGFSPEIDPEKKLFQKLIVLSAFGTFGFESIQVNNSMEIAKRLGCDSATQSKQELVTCMQNIPAENLIDVQMTMEEKDSRYFKNLLLAEPIVKAGGTIASLKEHPVARKMLRGVTEHEFESFAYKNYYVTGYFLDFENPVETTMKYRNEFFNTSSSMVNSDSSAVYIAASTYSQAIVNSGGDVYLYETRQKPYSMHTSDVQYFMGTPGVTAWTDDMRVLDSFYSKLLVNFTKNEGLLPNWEQLDPARMNFLVLEVDEEMGIGPHMEEGFHEELVDFWMINMTEIDTEFTKQKKGEQKVTAFPSTKPRPMVTVTEATTPTKTPTTTKNRVTENEQESTSEANAESAKETDPSLLEEDSAIYKQWWFYVVIVFAALVLVFVCIVLCRSTREEETPLL